MEEFKYNPEDGFLNETEFPNPTDDTGLEARTQFMKLFNQVRDHINNELAVKKTNTTVKLRVNSQNQIEFSLDGVNWDVIIGTGEAGKGVASGGTIGQILVKSSDEAYDTKWETLADCSKDKKGLAQVGLGLDVTNGVISSTIVPEIIVSTKQEETLTCTCGDTVLTGTTVNNKYTFRLPFMGAWVIKDSTEKLTQTIEVNMVKQYEAHIGYILGIKRDKTSSSPAWERTDDSVGLSATASIGSTKGQSDFDNIDIYKGIYRYTKDTGDVVVRVPKFYYKRYFEENVEFIKIADKQFEGFKVHPAFKKGDTEIDYFEVGAYKTTAGHFSKSGLAPLVNLTRDSFRTFAKVKGTGWGIIDIATVSAIQMLILVEYANNHSQSIIGSGNCSTNAAIVTGTTDSMYNEGNHTGRASGTDSAVNCIWRGIESFWGNVWEFTDGLNYNNGKYLICNKPQYYADDTDNQYTELAYTLPTGLNNTFIKELGYDASGDWCMMPTATGGDANTYITDAVWSSTGWKILLRGGDWGNGSSDGLFASHVGNVSSSAGASIGSRLLFLPL